MEMKCLDKRIRPRKTLHCKGNGDCTWRKLKMCSDLWEKFLWTLTHSRANQVCLVYVPRQKTSLEYRQKKKNLILDKEKRSFTFSL
jgi:hypothetical protein